MVVVVVVIGCGGGSFQSQKRQLAATKRVTRLRGNFSRQKIIKKGASVTGCVRVRANCPNSTQTNFTGHNTTQQTNMSALEQSLDAIIAKSGKPATRRNFKGKKPVQKQGKSLVARRAPANARANVAALNKKRVIQKKLGTAPVARGIEASSLQMATKVIVSGLPKDIKQDSIKVCFC